MSNSLFKSRTGHANLLPSITPTRLVVSTFFNWKQGKNLLAKLMAYTESGFHAEYMTKTTKGWQAPFKKYGLISDNHIVADSPKGFSQCPQRRHTIHKTRPVRSLPRVIFGVLEESLPVFVSLAVVPSDSKN